MLGLRFPGLALQNLAPLYFTPPPERGATRGAVAECLDPAVRIASRPRYPPALGPVGLSQGKCGLSWELVFVVTLNALHLVPGACSLTTLRTPRANEVSFGRRLVSPAHYKLSFPNKAHTPQMASFTTVQYDDIP